ncbi:LysR family transcriptional regulator [Neobacillus muris]|uniref:LysR family transcriptional regulator n=1 Tax=Neobacillus muris TaxID=2941334 RepID=UPI002041B906|nr:LysR family transcriptional regulator [Neobacillus muris]
MNIDQLKYMVEVAKTKSITIASQNYYVSQSGISRSIAALEKELGMKLFKRLRSGVEPTNEGKVLIEKAEEIVIKIQEFEELVQKMAKEINSILKVSAVPGLFNSVLLDSVKSFIKEHPNIKIEIDENPTEAIIEGVNQEKIDIGFIHVYQGIDNKYESFENLSFTTLLTTKLYALVSHTSPLASRSQIYPIDLLDQPNVIYNSQFVREFYQRLESKYGKLNILFASNNKDVIRKTVEDGRAITLAFDLAVKKEFVLNTIIKPIPFVLKHGQVQIPMGYLACKKGLSTEAKSFLTTLIKTLEKENQKYVDLGV